MSTCVCCGCIWLSGPLCPECRMFVDDVRKAIDEYTEDWKAAISQNLAANEFVLAKHHLDLVLRAESCRDIDGSILRAYIMRETRSKLEHVRWMVRDLNLPIGLAGKLSNLRDRFPVYKRQSLSLVSMYP